MNEYDNSLLWWRSWSCQTHRQTYRNKEARMVRTDKGESGQNVRLPDSTVSSWNQESQGLLSPDSSQPRIKFTLGKPKTKAAPASTLSSPVFRGPIRGHTGPCKGSWRVSLCCVPTGFLFLKVSWNVEKLLCNRSNEWRQMNHSSIHLRPKVY